MRTLIRRILDRAFTSVASVSVVLMAAALVLVLGPIAWRGAQAVVFQGTVEFRRMQLEEFHRGDVEAVRLESDQVDATRREFYAILDRFRRGIDTEALRDRAKDTFRQYEAQLRHRAEAGRLPDADARSLRRKARKLRNALVEAYKAEEKDAALAALADVLGSPDADAFRQTAAANFFQLAREYKEIVETVDLGQRAEYGEELAKVTDAVRRLFGPRPGETAADLAQFRHGATRWDQAQRILDELLWRETWVATAPGRPLEKRRSPREELFKGTALAGLFPLAERRLESMLRPRWTVYWQYFIDDSTPGHFFGGVGPEALGTLLLTALAMVLAVPVGVMTAAYLVECTRESLLMRIIRTCINTLAGVPSIVFGLFGLAFFVLWLLPKFRLGHGSSILAGSLTLALLVLPIIIRASEEALRAVPRSYKEASLSLGASGPRTFLTVTLPAAMPGILTGIILSMSRAAGETAPILFTAAVAVGPWPGSLFKPARALSYASYDIAVGDRLAAQVPHNQFGMILSLVLLVLVLNIAAILIRSRVARKLRGG